MKVCESDEAKALNERMEGTRGGWTPIIVGADLTPKTMLYRLVSRVKSYYIMVSKDKLRSTLMFQLDVE